MVYPGRFCKDCSYYFFDHHYDKFFDSIHTGRCQFYHREEFYLSGLYCDNFKNEDRQVSLFE